MFITPYVNETYGVHVQNSVKISKSEIQNIILRKSFWNGNKIIVHLNNGKSLKFKLTNNSWIVPASNLVLWSDSNVKLTTKKMTVREAFLLDCRITAKNLIDSGESFTLSQLVHKVVNDNKTAEEWLKIDGDKIYLALKEDIKRGELKAKIILVQKGNQIIYEKIKFEVKN